MRLPGGFADDVKNQADILSVISGYVALKKRGANYIACCPFHNEKTPSFNVHPGKGIFKCFGCGVGGSVFDFVIRMEGCGFPEAVRMVATKCGIPIPALEEGEDQKKTARDRESILRLNEWAAEFFEDQLQVGAAGASASEYIRSRGISEETRKLFRLGYAPDRWDGLLNYLKDRGASAGEIESSGLVTVRDDGKVFDRFRGRVMFPITDSQGRIIAFGGRVMGPGEPKYLNSPETAVYTKGRNLFGLALAKNQIRHSGSAVLVEGYLDCIIPVQAGVGNVVATLGTALTDAQVRLLRRYMERPRVVINFDPDPAGQNATFRSIELFLSESFEVNILKMPTDQDPDEFVRAHGADAFKKLIQEAKPYLDFVIERAIDKHDVSRPTGKVEAINDILPHLIRMPDKVGRADYAAQIADRLKIDSRMIREELKNAATHRRPALDKDRLKSEADVTQAERQLLEILLAKPDVRRLIIASLTEEDYARLTTEALFVTLIELEREGGEPDYDTLIRKLEGAFEQQLVPGLLMSDLGWAGADDFDTLYKRATEALSSLKRRRLEKKLDSIQSELSQGERDREQKAATMTPDEWERFQQAMFRLYQEKADVKRRMLQLSA
ncbi:MAG TPA: DNA primase [Blastocatellia bacterium]|nr:DNA primase [Blastocatellia bacterium]